MVGSLQEPAQEDSDHDQGKDSDGDEKFHKRKKHHRARKEKKRKKNKKERRESSDEAIML